MANQIEEAISNDAHNIGMVFVDVYYNTLHKSPDSVYKFYNSSSKLSRPGPDDIMTSVSTMQEINELLLSLNCHNYHTDVLTVDSQFSHSDGVIVLVTGWLLGNNERKKFAQTFFLGPQDPVAGKKSYYVLNDVFRFFDSDGSSPTPDTELTVVADQSASRETTSLEVEVGSSTTENHVGHPVNDTENEPATENGHAILENGHAEQNGHAEVDPVDSVKNIAPVAATSEETPVLPPVEAVPPPKKSFASVVSALKQNAAPFQVRSPLPKPAEQPRVRAAPIAKPEAPVPAPVPAANGAPEKNTDSSTKAHAIFVANLPMSATVDELDKIFKQFGPIKRDGIQVRSSRQQGTCFGFVEFESASSMQSAIEASPVVFGARKLSIEERRATNDRPKFTSGRSGYRNDNFRGGRGSFNGDHRGAGRNEFAGRARGNGEAHPKPTSNGGAKAAPDAQVVKA